MAHFGLTCPELSGHLNPMTTLGRELKRRGHRLTLIGRPDARAKTESAGLEFAVIGENAFPPGSLARTTAELGRLSGWRAMRFTGELLRRAAVTVLDEASIVISKTGVDALLVDQVTPTGATVAEMLNLPFVWVCNALALNPDPALPPAVTSWRYRHGAIWRFRNALGDTILRCAAKPILSEINTRRLGYALPPLKRRASASAGLAQIAQQPAFFDYPREQVPDNFHYTGPWHAIESGNTLDFPWERLDGRPLIYASMGTLTTGLARVSALRGVTFRDRVDRVRPWPFTKSQRYRIFRRAVRGPWESPGDRSQYLTSTALSTPSITTARTMVRRSVKVLSLTAAWSVRGMRPSSIWRPARR